MPQGFSLYSYNSPISVSINSMSILKNMEECFVNISNCIFVVLSSLS